ncbi:unnamed protein product [Dovyalis caffra]|uniref:Uncharacterized protein n=1 Tax=Dovyalis caffra TaxID=77055 RepID=A0AAV1RSP8_9ROSI|nr:unnamed protein product [Dovyalis caffra]
MYGSRRKDLLGLLDGSRKEPADDTKKSKWAMKNAKVVTWLPSSVTPEISKGLRSFHYASKYGLT